MHVFLSSIKANPSLHKQMNEPIVLLHLWWQPPFEITPLTLFMHSSPSGTKLLMDFKKRHLSEMHKLWWRCFAKVSLLASTSIFLPLLLYTSYCTWWSTIWWIFLEILLISTLFHKLSRERKKSNIFGKGSNIYHTAPC